MRIYIANLGKYNKGELVGAWFTLPVDYDEMAERIGLNEFYEEYAIHDYELPFEIDEYTPIEEVNRLCEMVEDLPEDIQDELSELLCCYSSLEELCEHADEIIHYPDCNNMTEAEMVTDVYSKIIDEDRRFNAQKMDKEFYSTLDEDTSKQPQDTGFSDSDMALLELLKALSLEMKEQLLKQTLKK